MADKTVTIRPSGGTYTTQAAARAGEILANTDLVTMDGILTISIEGDWSGGADTTSVNWNSFTVDASHYIKIITDSANKAGSSWSASKYIYRNALGIGSNYTRVVGLQLNANGAYAAISTGDTASVIDGCFVLNTNGGIGLTPSPTNYNAIISNCIVVGSNSNGINVRGAGSNMAFVDNCTVINSAGQGIRAGSTHLIKNCYCGNNTGEDFYSGTLTTCASEDATGTLGLRSIAYSTDNFTSITAGSENLSLPLGSSLIGVGTDLRADATWPFDYDIMGTQRGATWDVGAFEYVAAGGSALVPIMLAHNQFNGGM